jgi:uncharacterized protein YjiS (DUF1127 family)
MTSAIEYAALWTASGAKPKYNPEPRYAQSIEQIAAAAHVARTLAIGAAFAKLGGKLSQGLRALRAAQKRRSAVAQLMAMDDRMLRDIGLTRTEVPMVVCGLATGEAPDVFANARLYATANQANENSRNHAA